MRGRIWLVEATPLLALLIVIGLPKPAHAAHPEPVDTTGSPQVITTRISAAPHATLLDATATPPANVDAITNEPPTVWPRVQQNESAVWANGKTVILTYNDFLGHLTPTTGVTICHISLSRSTDSGVSFERILPNPLCSGHGETRGDPSIVYDAKLGTLGTWYAAARVLDTLTQPGDCGDDAFGVGTWYSTDDGSTWQAGSCAHVATTTNDDHPMMWVDNNPDSLHYGRLYIAWDNVNSANDINVTYSDDGMAWSNPALVTTDGVFRFLSGIVVSPDSNDTAFLAAEHIDDAHGLPPNWNTVPNDSALGIGPGATPVVHFVYAAQTPGVEPGNIYYMRSTDNGDTWSTPVALNGDSLTPQTQWMPSLSANSHGVVSVSWYDRRNSPPSPTPGAYDYQYWGRISTDNGATWQDEYQISNQTIPPPDIATPLPTISCAEVSTTQPRLIALITTSPGPMGG